MEGAHGCAQSHHRHGTHLSGRPAKGFAEGEGPQGRASGGERVRMARVLWHLLKFKQAFDWKVFEKEEQKMKRKKLARLQNLAAAMNYQLTPMP
jgi:hypothetical protein